MAWRAIESEETKRFPYFFLLYRDVEVLRYTQDFGSGLTRVEPAAASAEGRSGAQV